MRFKPILLAHENVRQPPTLDLRVGAGLKPALAQTSSTAISKRAGFKPAPTLFPGPKNNPKIGYEPIFNMMYLLAFLIITTLRNVLFLCRHHLLHKAIPGTNKLKSNK